MYNTSRLTKELPGLGCNRILSPGGTKGIRTLIGLLAKQVPYLSCHGPKSVFNVVRFHRILLYQTRENL